MTWRIVNADCREAMRAMEAESIDALVCDPPYDLTAGSRKGSPRQNDPEKPHGRHALQSGGFMGKQWDATGVAFDPETWRLALRVAKPGAHLAAFGGTRTHHRMMCAIEDAGWEIRDCLSWLYGSGFPKSLDVSKAIDAMHGNERGKRGAVKSGNTAMSGPNFERTPKGTPIAAAAAWDGFGTALKPAWEPIILARKPFRTGVAANVLKHGTGAINIDACRIATDDLLTAGSGGLLSHQRDGKPYPRGRRPGGFVGTGAVNGDGIPNGETHPLGRWPANVVLGCECDAPSLVFVESPYAGDIGRNLDYARECMADSIRRGEHPFASHLLYTQHGILCDDVPEERERGINAGFAFARLCHASVFYTDRGWSPGMKHGEDRARRDGRAILHRSVCNGTSVLIEHAEDCAVALLDAQSGELTSGKQVEGGHVRNSDKQRNVFAAFEGQRVEGDVLYGDSGGASRFFYCSKATSAEREIGLDHLPTRAFAQSGGASNAVERGEDYDAAQGIGLNKVKRVRNVHPTVKPVSLMQWLVRLVTPPGGLVLDPFMGSGSTGIAALREGVSFIGIEQDAQYCELARLRIEGDAPLLNAQRTKVAS